MLRKGMFLADRYEIIEQIGNGGMSDVYKAKCHKLNRFVAIKVLKPEYSQDKSFVSKFRAEAQSAAGLTHPNVVNVYDVGDEDGVHYIVMELIEGITLKKYIEKRGRLPYKEAVSIAIQVANGMEAAHKHHIVHRDIKPQNIIISKEGKVKVTDFGIAKAASSSTINSSSAMGSVHYISPEQARGGYSDERSDIYSFGITLYEMLTGKVPFDGDTTVAVAVQHIQDAIPAPSSVAGDVPVSVDKIVLKCTQKKTEARYQSASELIADLKKSLVMPDEDFVKLAPMYASQPKASAVKIVDEDEEFDDDDILDDDFDALEDLDESDRRKENSLDDDDDDEIELDIDDEDNDKLDKMTKWIGVGIIAVILIIAIFVVVKLVGGASTGGKNETTTAQTTQVQQTVDSSEKVSVPGVVGKTEDEAKEALNKLGLGYKPSYQPSTTVEKGKVIAQGTKEGTLVAKNTTITLTVSSGPDSVSVTNVVGMTEAKATSALKSAGFTVTVQYDYSDTVDQGNVISQSPAASAQASAGDDITITVSQGKKVTYAKMPYVVGLTEEAAKQAIKDQGLVPSVTYQSSSGTYGLVTAQGYNTGESLETGTTVTIVVSHYQNKTEPTTASNNGGGSSETKETTTAQQSTAESTKGTGAN
ncbi:MAG: Stk1 family PASTA domain-containing Ser/Thr kinase [Lachnospira sp.]|nr:Stk1 family PASTA domain-containing Ser/Thr kinase [Lachnospira sp.]